MMHRCARGGISLLEDAGAQKRLAETERFCPSDGDGSGGGGGRAGCCSGHVLVHGRRVMSRRDEADAWQPNVSPPQR